MACRYDTETLNPPHIAETLGHAQRFGLMPYTDPPYLEHAGGGGLAIRRIHHEAIGGFDEGYLALEDTDYCWRLQVSGVPLVFAPDAVVRIRLKSAPAAIFRQARHLARHNVRIYSEYRRHPPAGPNGPRLMPRLGALPGLLKLAKFALKAPFSLWTSRARARWLWQAGWRLGRVEGSLREGVLAF